MKILSFFFIFMMQITLSAQSNQQTKFRRDFNYFIISSDNGVTWENPQQGNNVFIFNVNERGDIHLYTNSGKIMKFVQTMQVKEGYIQKGGHSYQISILLDDEGNEIIMQLFNNYNLGLKLIHPSGYVIQFYN